MEGRSVDQQAVLQVKVGLRWDGRNAVGGLWLLVGHGSVSGEYQRASPQGPFGRYLAGGGGLSLPVG